ncbi:hypothetical protein FRC05_007958 [Tulasnella sp. 425]|nr:hypothetical protein FRC05_007958 [Tulasnella sp. 425]
MVNPPNRPEIRILSLVSWVPVGIPRDPPPLPPKVLGTSSCALSLPNEVAESPDSLAHLGDNRTPGSKFNLQQHMGQRHPPPVKQTRSESETNTSQPVLSFTPPFQNVEPRIVDSNQAHVPPEATITLHGTMCQNLHRISRTDVALSLVQGAALAKTAPLGKRGLATIAGSDMGAQSSAVLSQPDSPLSASPNPMAIKVGDSPNPPQPDSPLSASPNPTALKVGDSPNPPQPLSIHPPLGPSALPVTASISEGGISTSGAAEQEGDASPPQDDDTPRLESSPSVGSFVGLRSRWSSTTNNSTTEEAPPSFLQRFRFRNSKKANRIGQTSRKAKRPTRNKVTMFPDWALPSFLQCSTGSSHNCSLPPATGLKPSQSASACENDRETSRIDSNSSPVISAVIVKTAGPIRTRGAPVDPNEDNRPQYSAVLSHANGLFSAHPIPYKL